MRKHHLTKNNTKPTNSSSHIWDVIEAKLNLPIWKCEKVLDNKTSVGCALT